MNKNLIQYKSPTVYLPMESLKNGYQRKFYPFATKRYCQYLKMLPLGDKIEEYKHWHQKNNIWEEIPEGIRKAGILDMEII